MSHTSPQFVEFVAEQLAGIPGLATARFFGGVGLSAHGTQFGMVIGTALYFVVDDCTRPAYQARGSQCFAYDTRARRVQVMRYFEVPADVIEDREALAAWAREAVGAAENSKPKKRPAVKKAAAPSVAMKRASPKKSTV